MWDVTIKVIDRVKRQIRISAIHSIDAVVDYTYVGTGLINNPAQRSSLLDSIKDGYLEYLNDQAENSVFLAGLENTAVNALNTWEASL